MSSFLKNLKDSLPANKKKNRSSLVTSSLPEPAQHAASSSQLLGVVTVTEEQASHIPEPSASSMTIDPTKKKRGKKGFSSLPIAKLVVHQIAACSKIRIDSLSVFNPSATGFDIRIKLRISNTGPVKAKVSFPDGLGLFQVGTNKRIAGVTLPPFKIKPSAASSAVKAYAMKFGQIKFEKEVELAGLDRLGGVLQFANSNSAKSSGKTVEMADLQLVRGTPEKGIENRAKIQVENPSNATAQLGEVSLLLVTSSVIIGQLEIENLELKGGKNDFDATGSIKISAILPPFGIESSL